MKNNDNKNLNREDKIIDLLQTIMQEQTAMSQQMKDIKAKLSDISSMQQEQGKKLDELNNQRKNKSLGNRVALEYENRLIGLEYRMTQVEKAREV